MGISQRTEENRRIDFTGSWHECCGSLLKMEKLADENGTIGSGMETHVPVHADTRQASKRLRSTWVPRVCRSSHETATAVSGFNRIFLLGTLVPTTDHVLIEIRSAPAMCTAHGLLGKPTLSALNLLSSYSSKLFVIDHRSSFSEDPVFFPFFFFNPVFCKKSKTRTFLHVEDVELLGFVELVSKRQILFLFPLLTFV